ncbi:GAF domain-containing protein [Anaeromyxobacter dehalogenans]|uniref:Putative GAF sensor protein n=1 Tax=Anaeromyxobacter dehalogenans (strain 2CP-C) TaxID=290397 RepID=Q2IE06_ANADE|nr:GAF domain-containing protein [Anaeromyxobacter dehalogenans]ABC82817.1 putative GAF sensor protein [Anaeromyxobacter dehalogenans 2CP-C]
MTAPAPLSELPPTCFQGIVPAAIATCSRAGEPNVTYLSHVHRLDDRHVALSCQFFNKTKRNVLEHPHATVLLLDPLTLDSWRLRLRYDHAETEGPLFDGMAVRIQAIASHTGMAGVFRLLSADVYEVLGVERLDGFLMPPDPMLDAERAAPVASGPLTELRGLQAVSERINRAADLEALLSGAMAALDELLGFQHAMVLVPCEAGHLVAIASRGYGPGGIGAEVALGAGIIGTVAERRRMIRVAGVGGELRYGRAIRGRVAEAGDAAGLAPEIPLPGLPDAQAQLALPLLVGDRLVGVLAVESRDPLQFDEWDEAFLQIVANQIAMGMDRMAALEEDAAPAATPAPAPPRPARPAPHARRRTLVYYRNDDCVFVDGEYLIRNVPGKILWKVLGLHRAEGRTEFTNRELRLDPGLGLPPVKDNLESRLILLRRRLLEKCPDVRLVPVRRGRFALELDCALELVEKECG